MTVALKDPRRYFEAVQTRDDAGRPRRRSASIWR